MAEKAKEVIRWLRTLPEEEAVFIDEGGICLQHYGSPAYFEIGGSPEDSFEKEAGFRDIRIKSVGYPRPITVCISEDRVITRIDGRWALAEPDLEKGDYRALLYIQFDETFIEFEKRAAEYGKPEVEKTPKKETIVKFKRWTCKLAWEQYGNGRTALQLRDVESGELVATATTNIPHEELASDEVFIKDYSENDGILDVLIKAGIVEDTGRKVSSGWVLIPVCKILKRN